MNTRGSLTSLARAAGLTIERLDLVEKEPSCGLYARPFFILFMGCERLVNATERLAPMRSNLFAVLRRPR